MKRSDHTPRTALMIAALLLIVGTLTPLTDLCGGLTFSKDNDVVSDERDQRNYDLASSGSGSTAELYAVYEDYSLGSDSHVFFHRSANAGRNWQEPHDFMPSDPEALDKQMSPAIDTHTDGTIAVVYMDSTYRDLPNLVKWVIVVRTSEDNGATWSADRLVTPRSSIDYPSDEIKDPAIAFDPYGNLFVAWNNLEGQDRIDVAYSTDLGVTWSDRNQVPDHTNPESSDYDYLSPSIASDGQYVFVTWYDVNQYREVAYVSRAPASSLSGYPTLSFSSPERIATTIPYDYQSWNPRVVADTNAVHIVWWDFSTDPGGANNYPNIDIDRPSVKYVRSTDHGVTWDVDGKKNIILNTSDPEGWHSAPDIDLGSDGTLAVTWMDYTLNKPNIFVVVSEDMGSTWTDPARVNDHYPDIYREKPVAAVDDGGDAHAMWTYREDSNSDWDLKHARTIANAPPEAIDDLSASYTDMRYAIVSWTPNREPDFKRYLTFVSEEENFTIPGDLSEENKWPNSPYYNDSTKQLMNQEVFNRDIEPDTTYYAKVMVEDQEGLTSVSNEVTFRTRPVNKPPEFRKEIPTLYMDEDVSAKGILNLSYWREMGWIWDDVYNGHAALDYFIEPEFEEPNVTATIRKVGISPIYYHLDLYPVVENWYGDERFRIGVQDAGMDGGIGTPDDEIGYSDWFTVQVNSTNDVPTWVSFYDLNSDVNKPLTSTAKELRVAKRESGALEDMKYSFSLKAHDADREDFLEFSVNDERVEVKPDPMDLKYKAIFSLIPTNEDVPELNLTVTVSDRKGGIRNLTVYIPVENVNGPPVFTEVNGEPIPASGGSVDFSINEKGENSSVTFNVSAWDEDFGDVLTLKSVSDRPEIEKLAPMLWNVTVTATEEDGVTGFISFMLELWDKQLSDYATLLVNVTVLNVQDPPEFYGGKVKVFFTYDEEDEYEWNNNRIEAEWDEPVVFKAFAKDRDGDELTYRWVFRNEKSGDEFTEEGKEISVKFYPSDYPSYEDLLTLDKFSSLKSEKFLINLTVSDGKQASRDIYHYREQWVWPDDDNDNDGMPDKRELFFWDDLSQDPNDNYDLDEYTNIEEIGFGIPLLDSEIKGEYSIDRSQMDPTDPDVYPGSYTQGEEEEENGEEKGIPLFLLILIIVGIVLVVAVIGGIVVILRIQKKREEEEDQDIEKRVQQMEERQKTLQGLYGVQKAGDIIGPDQSTMDDLTLDLGGQVYHEEGSGALAKGVDKEAAEEKKKEKEAGSGPQWEKAKGPLFEESAPGLEFGESLKMDTVDEGELADDVDEASIDDTMGDLMSAAEEFNEDEVKNAGGKVLTGAVPMEEQIKQMQQQEQGQTGPRNPPPGQQPPQQQTPPQQAPPNVHPAPQQAPPTPKRVPKKEEEQ